MFGDFEFEQSAKSCLLPVFRKPSIEIAVKANGVHLPQSQNENGCNRWSQGYSVNEEQPL